MAAMQKGNGVSGETLPDVNLEVIVPRILLPEEQNSRHEDIPPRAASRETTSPATIEARLLSIQQGREPAQGEESTHATEQRLFHLFRFKHILAQGHLHLLQVVRKRENARDIVTDELAFSLEYRRAGSEDAPDEALATPEQHRVVVVLDEEGLPVSYSIDGVRGE